MILIAIDPGYDARGDGCACAMFREGTLAMTWFARPLHHPHILCTKADLVVWECPQVDKRTRVSTPAAVRLAAEGGMLAGLYCGDKGIIEAATPTQWKGTSPKAVVHHRGWLDLDDAGRAVLTHQYGAVIYKINTARERGAKDRWKPGEHYYGSWRGHNVLDAVCLGLWRLKQC